MAQISNITLPNGNTYNLKGSIYTVIGTQTAATGSWTGELKTIDALYDGLTIAYYLPWDGSGDATLNLTLKNNTTTGAINCYYEQNTRLTTHYKKGSIVWLTYFSAGSISIDGTETTDARWIAHANYNSNTTYSAMSKTEAWTGTATSSRTMRADYLKQILANLGGTGLTLTHNSTNGIVLNHDNYVTAGTAGTSSATSGATLAVPYVTYNAQGHITAAGTHTHTITGFLTSSSSLDASKLTGTVPTSALPSYVDDVLEYTAKANFPTTGEEGKIYVDKTTNLTWRWGGSAYVEISPSLAIGTTASTAAKGNHTHTVIATGNVTTTTATTENKTATVSAASSGTTTYTPAGTNSAPTFTGTAATISVSKSYTPAGSVAAPTFTGTKATGLTVSPASSGTATYTPAGTISVKTAGSTNNTLKPVTAKTVVTGATFNTVVTGGTTTDVPNISKKTVVTSVTPATVVTSVTKKTVVTGTSVANEVLSFTTGDSISSTTGASATVSTGDSVTVGTAIKAYTTLNTGVSGSATTGDSVTLGSAVTVKTGDAAYQFAGTGARLILQDYTPAGSNSAPAFTGTAATITSTGSYTPAGSVSAPTFTGTAVRLVTGNIAVPKTYTSTFSGTSATTSVPA